MISEAPNPAALLRCYGLNLTEVLPTPVVEAFSTQERPHESVRYWPIYSICDVDFICAM
jgi:hypothetical protein